MFLREIEHIGIAQRSELLDAQRLHRRILGMFERQIEELAPVLVHVRVPALADRLQRQLQRERIGGEGLGGAAVDVAAELVEQDQRRQQRLGIVAPARRARSEHQIAQGAEARLDLRVELGGGREMLLGREREPEAQHFAGLRVDIQCCCA